MQNLSRKIILFFILIKIIFSQDATLLALANEYYNDGEYEKAIEYYKRLVEKNPDGSNFYYQRIYSSFVNIGDIENAIKYFKSQQKKNKYGYIAKIYLSDLYEKKGLYEKSQSIINEVLNEIPTTRLDIINAANTFVFLGKYEVAIKVYDLFPDKEEFNLAKARLLFYGRHFKEGISLLLQSVEKNRIQYEQFQKFVINSLREDNIEDIETAILQLLQKYPKNLILRKLLYNFYVNQGMWEEAFIQVKALERQDKKRHCGSYLKAFAEIAKKNKQYDIELQAYKEILKCGAKSPFYLYSLMEITNRELQEAINTFPVDSNKVRSAISKGLQTIEKYNYSSLFLPIYLNVAKLYAYFTPHKDSALYILDKALFLNLPYDKIAEVKLLKADIYLLMGEFQKAKLLYLEVDKDYKGTEIGTQAKFKFAKLNYYIGDFETAMARASTLKENTFDLIANDAIRLFLIIQDNIGLDTTEMPLKMFAKAQLFTEQYQYDSALIILDSLQIKFPNHPLKDDILWQKFTIYKMQNDTIKMLFFLDKLINSFPNSIWTDDALFQRAVIYEGLKKYEDAINDYIKILRDFPSSIFAKQARTRARQLRKKHHSQ